MAGSGRRKTLVRLVAALGSAVLASMSVAAAVPAAASVTRLPLATGQTLSGVVGGGGEPAADAFSSWRGRPVQVITSYTSTNSWDLITGVTTQGLTQIYHGTNAHLVWSVPLLPLDGSASLALAATGAYNAKYAAVAQQLVKGGDGSATIRLGWELNGNWFSWSGEKSPAAFVAAWRQAVTAMRNVPGAHFTFDWNTSLGFSDPTQMYPGDGYVDLIGADVYDASYSSAYPSTDHTAVWANMLSESWGLNWLAGFAAEHGKRISIPEWGVQWLCNGHGGGDDPYFIQQMHNWIASHDVAYEAYFNDDLNSCNNSALNDGRFPQAAAEYKKLESVATTPPVVTAPAPPPVAAPPATPAPTALDLSDIQLSTSPARTNGGWLFAATVTGPAYIWLVAAPGITQVRFFLDRPTTSTPTTTDTSAPWDLEGGTTAAANPLPYGSLKAGSHQMTVMATLSSGVVQSATVSFTVK